MAARCFNNKATSPAELASSNESRHHREVMCVVRNDRTISNLLAKSARTRDGADVISGFERKLKMHDEQGRDAPGGRRPFGPSPLESLVDKADN
jgi:hypothetical protein